MERVFYLTVIGNLKTVIIMANIELKFLDATGDNSWVKCESVECPDSGGKFISIESFNHEKTVVWLDITTAIKFAKTLRTEINKIKEVDNA